MWRRHELLLSVSYFYVQRKCMHPNHLCDTEQKKLIVHTAQLFLQLSITKKAQAMEQERRDKTNMNDNFMARRKI